MTYLSVNNLGTPKVHVEHPFVETAQPAYRSVCYRCHKPQRVCICSLIKPVINETGITILQHPKERFHPIGTARIARLGLSKVDLRVVWQGFHADSELEQKIPPNAGLLFPSSNARDLASLSPEERPAHLVVLDGTWSTVNSLYRSNPCLHRLPHYSLSPDAPSQYRIRKEPKDNYRSTIEAIWQALRLLEPNNETIDGLMDTFAEMIQRQVDFETGPEQRRRPKRWVTRASKAIPPVFLSQFENIVVGYGEFIDCGEDEEAYQLMYWSALRPATGESFAAAIQVDDFERHFAPEAPFFKHTELESGVFKGGLPIKQFKEEWRAFFGPEDTLAAWNQITLTLFDEIVPQSKEPLLLKGIYCNHIGEGCGDLGTILEREGLRPMASIAQGRPQIRLGNAAAIADFLHSLVA